MLPLQIVRVSLPTAGAPSSSPSSMEDSPLVTSTHHHHHRGPQPSRWWHLTSYERIRGLSYGTIILVTLVLSATIITITTSGSSSRPSTAVDIKGLPPSSSTEERLPVGALSAAPDSRLGVCYDPVHHPAYPGNMPLVFSNDMPLIARNFRLVRTFYANYYGVDVMPFVAAAGLKAALGVSIANGQADAEKGAAIRAWYDHGDHLSSVLVGNEDLMPVGPFTVDDIIWHMNDLRKAGLKCPIGTVQRINEWLVYSPEIDRLAAAADIIGVNIYPFFSTPHNGGEAWEMDNAPVENMRKQFEAVRARFPGQEWKVRIMETGWPTQGTRNFAGHDSSLQMGSLYYHGFVSWACAQDFESYYYEYFDKRWATSPDYEQFFGVTDADGNPKYDGMSNGYC